MRNHLFLFCLGIVVAVASVVPPFVGNGEDRLYWQPISIFLILGILSGATLVVISMIGLMVEGYRSRRYLRHVGLLLGTSLAAIAVFGGAVGALALAFFVDRPLDAESVGGRLYRLSAQHELDDMGGVAYVVDECAILGLWCHAVRIDTYWIGRPPPDQAWLETAPNGDGVIVRYDDNSGVVPSPTAP